MKLNRVISVIALGAISATLLLFACKGQPKTNDSSTSAGDTTYNVIPELEERGIFENDCHFKYEAIDEEAFTKLHAVYYKKYETKRMTNFEEVRKLLGKVVEWKRVDEDGTIYDCPAKINFRNGKTLYVPDYTDEGYQEYINQLREQENTSVFEYDFSFVAYYPEEDILLLTTFNCGDDGDVSFNLTTGAERDDVADPEYTFCAPGGKRRFRGFYNGYVSKFIYQVDQGSGFVKSCDFPMEIFGEMFFANDSTFYFQYSDSENNKRYGKATIPIQL